MPDFQALPQIEIIAGSDSASCSGIQADNATAQAIGVYPLNALTAATAQNPDAVEQINPLSTEALQSQLSALRRLRIRARKIGMIASSHQARVISRHLQEKPAFTVLDPVMLSSTGTALGEASDALRSLCHSVDLVTPNIPEAETLSGLKIRCPDDMKAAARAIGQRCRVYLKGGHLDLGQPLADLYFDPARNRFLWFIQTRQTNPNRRGTGCTLATALASYIARGYTPEDACCLASAFVQQGIRKGHALDGSSAPGPIARSPDAPTLDDFPRLADNLSWTNLPPFPDCGSAALGLYPIVDSLAWLKRLLPLGISTCQLRIKGLASAHLRDELKEAINLGRQNDCRLFINDHWQIAAELGAYGVHLGQEDLEKADLGALSRSGLRLGISTHSESEWARAMTLRPSYIALGSVFPTRTKPVKTIGLENLRNWLRLLKPQFQTTAIGGITEERLETVLAAGADSIAVVSAITDAQHPEEITARWIARINAAS